MFIGHYGPAIWDAHRSQGVRLWHAFLAVQAIDFVSISLALMGVEGGQKSDGLHPLALNIDWSHSFLSAIIISLIVAIIYRSLLPKVGWKSVVIMGVLAFSHWPLDWLVHRPDLPLYPGGELMLGLGLWNYPWLTFIAEVILFWGMIFWWLSVTRGKLWTALTALLLSVALTALHFDIVTHPTLQFHDDGSVAPPRTQFENFVGFIIFIGSAAIIAFVERYRDVKSDRL